MIDLTIENLFSSGAHYGHLLKYSNKKMLPYIYGSFNKISIIDLNKTLDCFKSVLSVIENISAKGGTILFVGTKKCAKEAIKRYATLCGMPFINHRWLGGLLTNFNVMKKSIGCLNELKTLNMNLNKNELTRSEYTVLNHRLRKLSLNFEGIINLSSLPDLLIVIDSVYEKLAIKEALFLQIPTIAFVDTNGDPNIVTYPVPANDDSVSCICYYLEIISEIILKSSLK